MSDALLILRRDEIRALVPLDLTAVDRIEAAFATLAGGGVVMPPVLSVSMLQVGGEADVKTAFIPGLSGFAVKISPGFFGNTARGLPSTSGLMVVLSSETGQVRAVLLDEGWLTDVRTAAAGAQARMQLEVLTLVGEVREAAIWARDPDRARAAAGEMTDRLGLPVRAERDAEAAVRGADIIVTTTSAREPILRADWLEPSVHVTAMGSDHEHKNELGEVVSGAAPGRPSDDAVTIADLTGLGVQDTAIADHVLTRAAAREEPRP